jgi:hypothetical protein
VLWVEADDRSGAHSGSPRILTARAAQSLSGGEAPATQVRLRPARLAA